VAPRLTDANSMRIPDNLLAGYAWVNKAESVQLLCIILSAKASQHFGSYLFELLCAWRVLSNTSRV